MKIGILTNDLRFFMFFETATLEKLKKTLKSENFSIQKQILIYCKSGSSMHKQQNNFCGDTL